MNFNDYITGCDVLGFSEIVGEITDTKTDYDRGQSLYKQLIVYFESIGKPAKYVPAIKALTAAYDDAEAGVWWTATDKWFNATKMKQVGADAAALMMNMEADFGSATPSTMKNTVYDPGTGESLANRLKSSVPWWAWALGGVVVLGTGAYFISPVVAGWMAKRKVAKGLSGFSSRYS